MKINKKIKFSLIALSSVLFATLPISLIAINRKDNISHNLLDSQNYASTTPIANRNYDADNSSLEAIANELGPIVVDKATVINYDWYGNASWTLDLSKYGSSTTVTDWEFIQSLDLLYLITDTSYLIKIKSTTGEILANLDKATSQIETGSNSLSFIAFNQELYVWNSFMQNGNVVKINTNTLKKISNVGNQGSGRSILGLLRLDVGYNLIITTTSTISSTSPNVNNLSIAFVDDSLKNFIGNVPPTITPISLSTAMSYKNIFKNIFYRKTSADYVLIVLNQFYQITLNKQNMSLTKATHVVNSTTIKNINSAFITQNDVIYFKSDSDTKIYTIRPNTTNIIDYINLATITNNEELKNVATSVNKIQIFGVNSPLVNETSPSLGTHLNLNNTISVVDPNSKVFGGILNAASLQPFSVTKPDLEIANTSTFYSSIPSAITSSSFVSKNADNLVSSNVDITVNDLLGTLVVKAKLTKNAWYNGNNSGSKTTSIINKNYTLTKIDSKFSFANQNSFDSISNGYFKNKTPSQILQSDLNNFAEQVLPVNNVNSTNLINLKRTFIITSTDDSNGKIKIKAIVSYTNFYNNFVSFIVPEKEYTVKKITNADYKFEFEDDNSTRLNSMKIFLPMLINPSNDQNIAQLSLFIKTENNYPPQRRVILLTPNDTDGTLLVKVIYNGLAPTVPASFSKTFTGFASLENSKIIFNGNDSTVPNTQLQNPKIITSINEYKNYSEKLVTDIKVSDLSLAYNFQKLAAMGFIPDVSISPFTPVEQEFGALTIKLDFSKKNSNGSKLPSIYKDSFGLKDYVITQQYVGFLEIGKLYRVELKSYSSTDIQNLINNFPINSVLSNEALISTLNLVGFKPDEIEIIGSSWQNETLNYFVRAQSKQFPSVIDELSFSIDYSFFFQQERTKNLIIAIVVIAIVMILLAIGIAIYTLRKNKIRRMLK